MNKLRTEGPQRYYLYMRGGAALVCARRSHRKRDESLGVMRSASESEHNYESESMEHESKEEKHCPCDVGEGEGKDKRKK